MDLSRSSFLLACSPFFINSAKYFLDKPVLWQVETRLKIGFGFFYGSSRLKTQKHISVMSIALKMTQQSSHIFSEQLQNLSILELIL